MFLPLAIWTPKCNPADLSNQAGRAQVRPALLWRVPLRQPALAPQHSGNSFRSSLMIVGRCVWSRLNEYVNDMLSWSVT